MTELLTKCHRQPYSPGSSARRHLTLLTGVVAALGLLLSWPTVAAGATWVAVAVSGTVLSMHGDQWAELPARSPVLDGIPVRTLQGAAAELARGEITLQLGPNTALQVDQAASNLTLVTQYAGTVSVDARIPLNQRLMLKTPKMTVVLASGHSRLIVAGDTGEVAVDLGTAIVVDLLTGKEQTVPAGVTLAEVTAAETLPETANGRNNSANGNAGGNGKGSAGGTGKGNAGGTGNGNAGGTGNGNAGSNGNGNAGSNGNGNAGSNGNGNAGGNGNGNAGSNGNGNAGGNGNGNAGSNGNGNAGGNGNGNAGSNGNGNAGGNGNGNAGSNGNGNAGGNGNGGGNGNTPSE